MTKTLLIAAALAISPLAAIAEETPGAHFLLNWDLDEDGSVTVAEATTRRGDVFYTFDQDENDVLDAAEYVLFDETRAADMENNAGGHGKGGHRMQVGLTMDFNDTDANGEVTRAEFVDNTARWIADVDRDGDGAITAADFGPKRN